MNVESQVLNVPIEDIIPNRFQPRLNFDETALNELAASIKEHGIIQPLVLRRLSDKYEIIAGERRYKAAKMAGLTYVPAIISEMDDKKSAEVAIVENIQRKDLSAIEEAKSYKALLDKGYLTQDELAKKMGISQSAVSNKMRLLSLAPDVQDALMNGQISERHARSLLRVTDVDAQKEWLSRIINERLTVQNLDKLIKEKEKKEEKEDPIVEVAPVINDINNNQKDIINTNSTPNPFVINDNPIPNKFFNFLEDEEVNMNTEEVVTPSVNDNIEMLDFIVPSNNIKDLSTANNLIDKLVMDLNNNNYSTELNKEDNDKEIKYIITVKKED